PPAGRLVGPFGPDRPLRVGSARQSSRGRGSADVFDGSMQERTVTNRRWAAGLVGAALILTPGVASFGQEAPPVDPPARPDFEPEPALEPTEPPAAADPNDNGLAPRPSSPGVRPSIAPRATPAAPARSGVESIPGLKDA